MPIQLTSVQEAALNAVDEALGDLPFSRVAMSRYATGGHFVHADFDGESWTAGGMGRSFVEAAREMVEEANALIANPPPKVLRDPFKVKEAAQAIVEEYRAGGGEQHLVADEIADRIAALPVK